MPQLEKSPGSNKNPAQPKKEKTVVRGHGAVWVTVHGVAKGWTLLRHFERERERERERSGHFWGFAEKR